jgi:hypothetical protein
MAWLKRVVEATGGDPLKDISTSAPVREMAGFSQAEVTQVARLERQTLGSPGNTPNGPRDE